MTKINVLKRVKLKNAILIEGLPGVGNVGRVAVGYLIEELKATKFADLYSEWFFPFVMLENNHLIHLLKNEFYYWKAKRKGQRDLVFLIGDCQSHSPQGHYEIAEAILDFTERIGVTEIITVGGLAVGDLESYREVLGAVTDEKLLKRYEKYGINFNAGEKVGYIVGATGLLLGLWKQRGKDGLCLLGQTAGFPITTDPRAAESVLDVLTKILNIKVDMTRLERKVKDMESFIKKVESLQRKALMEITKAAESKTPKPEESEGYIG